MMFSRKRQGFTLIELLVAVLVIGVISALVYPKFGPVKERTYVAAMKNSLNKAVTAQENYLDANNVYAASETVLNAGTGYQLDDDVTVATWTATTNAAYGFYIILNHTKSAAACGIEYGASGPGGTEWSGKIYCDPEGDAPGTDEGDIVDGT